jgi:hypothetical protein
VVTTGNKAAFRFCGTCWRPLYLFIYLFNYLFIYLLLLQATGLVNQERQLKN